LTQSARHDAHVRSTGGSMQSVPVSLANALSMPCWGGEPAKVEVTSDLWWEASQGNLEPSQVLPGDLRCQARPFLPVEALVAPADPPATSGVRVPASPPPALPPSVPLSLWSALPAEPPVLPPAWSPREEECAVAWGAASPALAMQLSLFAALPSSPPPSAPPSLPCFSAMQSPEVSPHAGGESFGFFEGAPSGFFEGAPSSQPSPWQPEGFPAMRNFSFEASATETYPGLPPLPDWPARVAPGSELPVGSPLFEAAYAEPWATPFEATIFTSPATDPLAGRALPFGADFGAMPALPPMPAFSEWPMAPCEVAAGAPPGVELPPGALTEAAGSPMSAHSQQVARFPPGLSPPAGSPSHGSLLHGGGHCRPCAWFWKAGGCLNGEDCAHCHLCPEGEIKARKKAKQTMMQLGLATPTLQGLPAEATVAPAAGQPSVGFGLEAHQQAPVVLVKQHSIISSASDQASTTGSATILTSEPDAASCAGQEDGGSGSDEAAACGLPPGLYVPPGAAEALSRRATLAQVPNVGSALHGTGKCRPCAWFHKSTACQKNQECNFCHLCPESALKARKKSKMNAARKDSASSVEARFEQNPHGALSLASLL